MLIHFLAQSSMRRWIPLSLHIMLALPSTEAGASLAHGDVNRIARVTL